MASANSQTPQDSLKAALVEVRTLIDQSVQTLESEPDQSSANTLKDLMIQAQGKLSESFITMRALRREVFQLQPGQTQHGDAARSA